MNLVDPPHQPDSVVLTSREMDVMNVLWRLGSGTVPEVRAGLEDDLAYTTVLTILRILEDKGHVSHEAEGRAHRYVPVLDRNDARLGAIHRMRQKLFSDSPELLMAHLLSDEALTEEQISHLRGMVEEWLEGEEPEGEEPKEKQEKSS